jgi:apolipoprotein D and lipocalin family protein
LSRVTATYSLREDGGVRVVNRGFNADEGEWEEAEGKAYLVDDPTVGQLKVSFFGPFYGGYNVVELDQADYRYALVVGPTRSYLWILAREPTLDLETLDALRKRASRLGFDTGALIQVEH